MIRIGKKLGLYNYKSKYDVLVPTWSVPDYFFATKHQFEIINKFQNGNLGNDPKFNSLKEMDVISKDKENYLRILVYKGEEKYVVWNWGMVALRPFYCLAARILSKLEWWRLKLAN